MDLRRGQSNRSDGLGTRHFRLGTRRCRCGEGEVPQKLRQSLRQLGRRALHLRGPESSVR